jgi:hypothetical protein
VDSPGGGQTGVSVCVPCNAGSADAWLATQFVLENGLILSDTISQRLHAHCQSLADPKPKVGPTKIGPPRTVPE